MIAVYNTKCRGDRDAKLSPVEYLNIIRPYLRDMVDNHKAHSEWKMQIIMRIIFASSLSVNEIHKMHTKSDNIEIMSGTETNDIINELFKSFLRRYQEGLETKMKGSSFIFERVDLLDYYLHKISLNRGGSYIDSPKWLKTKKATINPKNNDDECFKHAITVALNHEKIGKDPQRISKIRPFIDNYNWYNIEFPSHSKDWKKFEQNNKATVLNILFVKDNTKQIRQAYISKYNNKRNNQVILLMITDNVKWHYITVKRISRLLRGITSNHVGDFYCLNCFHSYTTEKKNKKHERICKDHDSCHAKMPDENNEILKYNLWEKSLKVPFIIYADLECLLQKINSCQNNPKKSYTEKKVMHKPSGYSLVTCCSFDKSKTEWNYYRRKDCAEIFCKDLRDQSMKIINYEKKKNNSN